MTDGSDAGDWFSLQELTPRLAGLVWVEAQVADLLDSWATIEPIDVVGQSFARAAGHHRWHAEQLADCLPTAAALAELALPRAPHGQWERVVEALGELIDPDRSPARLTAIVREVNPWLARETDALVACVGSIAEPGLIRRLHFVDIDHREDGAELAQLLDELSTNTIELRDRSLLAAIELTTRAAPPAPPG